MLKDESFGIIPLRRVQNHWEVFLIQHKEGGYWGFPKGHAEPDETHRQSATRELKEETDLDVLRYLQEEPLSEQYSFLVEGRRIFKRVLYFVAEVRGEARLQEQEINDGLWLPFPEAVEKVTHPEGKNLLHQVEKILPNSY